MAILTRTEYNEADAAATAAALHGESRKDRAAWMFAALVAAGWEAAQAKETTHRWLY